MLVFPVTHSLLVVCLLLCLVILDSNSHLVTLGFPTEYLILLGTEGKHQPENILHLFGGSWPKEEVSGSWLPHLLML